MTRAASQVDIQRMRDDLAPLRRVEELLKTEALSDDIVRELAMLFGLDFVDAIAAIAAVLLLHARGHPVPIERPSWHHTDRI
jgi:hypothetical protein